MHLKKMDEDLRNSILKKVYTPRLNKMHSQVENW